MKLTGITGTGSGKLGSAVFSVSAGEQVVRQYQPVVTNPSTSAQVDNRAKLKLLSQLSAVMADVIAIPRQGALSPRNIFVSENYPLATADNGVANINLAGVSLTKAGMQIPAVVAERNDDTAISVALASKADQLVARVIYIMFYRNTSGELQLIDSAVVGTAGPAGTFPYAFPYEERDVIVYAYGIFDKNSKATAKFGNYSVTDGTQVASLIADRKLSESDYLLTKTRGVLLAGVTHIDVTSVVCNTISVASSGSTTIPYDNSVAIEVLAEDVQGKILAAVVDGVLGEMRAFPASGSTFVGAFDLVGGENIRVQIGHMDGANFVAEYTYGGTIVIAAQSTAFTSLSANGVAIAASGNTQVADSEEIVIAAAASGVVGKYLRVSVNGVANTPVAFSNGAASDSVHNAAVGNTITFQIGRVVNGTFVEDVAYGGTAVVAEVPATFTSVAVNGTTIAASGSTNVVAQASNSIVVVSQNASGKYLAVLNGNNEVVSVHAISGNTTTISTANVAGDSIKFAIGTGSSTSSFVAQTNFGGTCVFTQEIPTEVTNFVVNGQQVLGNMTAESLQLAMSGHTTLEYNESWRAALIKKTSKPNVGTKGGANICRSTIVDGNFSGSETAVANGKYWLVIGVADQDGYITPSYVYPYYILTPAE